MNSINQKTAKNRLISKIRDMVEDKGTMLAIAKRYNVNPGVVWRVYHGGDSPQLRRKLGIRKTNRTRLCIDCDQELKDRFYEARGDFSSADFLSHLLDWYEYEEG